MALIVYLDTQDYIKLFNEPQESPNHQVLTKLLAYRDRGEIVIGFSFVTIMEFITKPDVVNRPERVRRGQLIKDICGPHAFPYPTDLAKGATFPNRGRWMHTGVEKALSAKEFRADIHKAIVKEFAKTDGLNRHLRRKIGKKGTMSQLIRESASTWGRKRSDFGQYPVSDEIIQSRLMERFLKGQCSDSEFETRMNAWISDPAEFSRIAYDYADQPNMIEEFFGKATDEIERMAKSIQDALIGFQQFNVQQLKIRENLIQFGMDKYIAKKVTKQFPLPEVDVNNPHERLEAAFGKDRVGHFNHYLGQIMKPGYSFKRSDVMDIMQMCYVYDCDLFRCDKAMENTFRDYQPFQNKLVGRFTELPDRIERLLVATA